MKEQKNNKRVGSRVFYLVISLLIAFFLWMYVEYVEQPDIEQNITRVPVTIIGQEELLARDLVLTEGEGSYVTVRVKGIRSVVSRVDADDIRATLDVSGITAAGDYQRSYTVAFGNDVSANDLSVVSRAPATVSLHVSNVVTKSVPIEGTLEGSVASEYAAEEFTFDPAFVEITGPEEQVELVDRAHVVIERENVSASIEEEVPFVLQDADGNAVDTEDLTLSTETVRAMLSILKVRTVGLTLELIEGGGLTAESVKLEPTPGSITVSGEESVVDALADEISLGTVHLEEIVDQETTLTFPINIRNVKIISGETEASFRLTLGDDVMTRTITVSQFRLIGVPEEYEAAPVTQTLEVTLRGTRSQMGSLSTARITAVADLSTLGNGTGTYLVPTEIEITGADGIGVLGEYSIYVQIYDPGETGIEGTSA